MTAYEMRISDCSSYVCSSDLSSGALSSMRAINRPGSPLGTCCIRPCRLRNGAPLSWSYCTSSQPIRENPTVWSKLSTLDRKSVGAGKSVSVRVDLGGGRIITKKKSEIIDDYIT